MVERMTTIMEAFTSPSARLSLEDVARVTGLPRSTAHRIMNQLVGLHWIQHTPAGYSLGSRALGLGTGAASHTELREAAAEDLRELHLQTGLVVHLAVLDGSDVRYLDKVGGRYASKVPTRVGDRRPAHCTGLGKAMLATVPAEDVDGLLGGQLRRMTRHSIGDVGLLHQELTRVRARRGAALDRGECHLELGCVAAAVPGADGPLGAVSLVGDPSVNFERLVPLVLSVARGISSRMDRRRSSRSRHADSPSSSGWSSDTLDRLVAVGSEGWL
ncbi:IclR family transcriptional regulator [Nocardioides sp. zg-DK7169]|nr:IclR family transcriptional regulator [Nocardioides sp. zg-DK7169]